MSRTLRPWKLFCAGLVLTVAGILMCFSDVVLRAQDALRDPQQRIEAQCDGMPLPPGKMCCKGSFGEKVYDPTTHGCCGDGVYNLTTQDCCKTKLTYTKGPGVKCCSVPKEITNTDGSTTWVCDPAIATPPQKCCEILVMKPTDNGAGIPSTMRLACEVVWNPVTQCCCKAAQIIIGQPCAP